MTPSSLLAVLEGDGGSEAVVDAAIGLGRHFDALVRFLAAETPPEDVLPLLGDAASGAMVDQILAGIEAEAARREALVRELYQRRCVDAGLPVAAEDGEPAGFRVRLEPARGRIADLVAQKGRLADLILVERPTPDQDSGFSPALEAAMFDTGRPVLMLPPESRDVPGATAAVAWDGSREASRAVLLALPLLSAAKRVVILTAQDGSPSSKPSELARYLGEHGIEAVTWSFAPDDGPVGRSLLAEARKAKADLLVMGAYGHSRLRELVLGGVTRSIVSRAELPVLLVH